MCSEWLSPAFLLSSLLWACYSCFHSKTSFCSVISFSPPVCPQTPSSLLLVPLTIPRTTLLIGTTWRFSLIWTTTANHISTILALALALDVTPLIGPAHSPRVGLPPTITVPTTLCVSYYHYARACQPFTQNFIAEHSRCCPSCAIRRTRKRFWLGRFHATCATLSPWRCPARSLVCCPPPGPLITTTTSIPDESTVLPRWGPSWEPISLPHTTSATVPSPTTADATAPTTTMGIFRLAERLQCWNYGCTTRLLSLPPVFPEFLSFGNGSKSTFFPSTPH
jgi:hypothetical protein